MMSYDRDFETLVPSFFHIVDRHCDKNWKNPLSIKNFHNFFFLIEGDGVCYTKGQTISLEPGMLIYHYPNQTYGFDTSKTNLMHLFAVNFHIVSCFEESGNWGLKNIEKLPFETIMKLPDTNLLVKHFTNLVYTWNATDHKSLLKCRIIFLRMLQDLWNQTCLQSDKSESFRTITKSIDYIKQHYHEQITINELASLSDLTPNYFISTFKNHIGMTPIEYINSIRIEKSIEYFNIGYSIKEAALLVGFSDQYYYSRVFKKFKGVCPRDFPKEPQLYY